MSISASQQAGLYYPRRRSRSQRFIAQATAWTSGLTVSEGDIVQSNAMAWQAQNGGVTAGTAPNNNSGASFTDGGEVKWLHLPLLLVTPTPI